MHEAEPFFPPALLQRGLSFYQDSRVSISFTKGGPESYYICSGLVRDDRNYECKIVFKKRFVGTDTPALTTQCNCHIWNQQQHCAHCVALFLSYHHHLEQEKMPQQESSSEEPPLPMAMSFGVTVHEYGSIINGPQMLLGAMPNSTYSSLQYLLHDKKIINFPIPQPLTGTVILNIQTLDEQGLELKQSKISYQLMYADGTIEKKISIFEHLYLFNWKRGEAYSLDSELRELLRKIRLHGHNYTINDYIQIAEHFTQKDDCRIMIDGKLFKDIPTVHPQVHIALTTNHARKNHISFKITFTNDIDIATPIPDFLQGFTFNEGLLTSFSRKKDAYLFLEGLYNSIENETHEYKKHLIASSKRQRIQELVDMTTSGELTKVYFPHMQQLVEHDNRFILKLFHALYKNFGDLFFRFGEYDKKAHALIFQVSISNLFRGLTSFYTELAPYGISIFYNKQEIKRWNSRIRFERKKSMNSWFDLELQISDEDLEIIKNADLDSGMALTSQGLVYLSPEQKELLKFVKRYTQYEAQKIEKAKVTDSPLEEGDPQDELNKFLLPFHRARIFELFELHKLGLEGALTKEEEDLCQNLASFSHIPEAPISDHLQPILRDYQKTGHHWLNFLYKHKLGACLADDMGLGKTLQSISFLESIYDQIERVIIICPVTLLINWQKEIEKFSKMDIEIYHGGERQLHDDKKIILTSYGIMKKEVHTTFEKLKFDVMILDEVQHLKNIRSQGAYAARQLQADFRICLTGTPVENDLAEFYNIMDLSIPGIWGDLQFIKTTSDSKSRLLARKTAKPFILRRTKSQVLTDLPPKIENNVYLEFSEYEDQLYKNKLKEIQQRLALTSSKRKYGEILKGLLELRQLCLWRKDNPTEISTKVDFLLETIEQIQEENHQAIIFSQFTTYLDVIQKEFNKRLWKYSRIDGSQTVKHRQKEVDRFQNGETKLFLISLKAGGVGLNLTAASYVFVMDPWWNPAVENQAIDRAHRIGQTNKLNVYRPIIKNSVEEKILILQDMKKRLFLDLLPENDDNYFTGKLSMRDFEDLLS